MQATKHKIYALRLFNIVFFCKPSRKCIRPQFFCKNLIKIKKIRFINRFLYALQLFDIEDTFYTAHSPTSLCILLART